MCHALENMLLTLGDTEVIERVKDYINARPDIVEDRNIWIQGMGWDQTKWGPGAGFPTAVGSNSIVHLHNTDAFQMKAEFDAEPLLRGRPIVLRRVDGHALWVSSRVIKELGSLPDHIEGGAIIRYENGKPTGEIYCLLPTDATFTSIWDQVSSWIMPWPLLNFRSGRKRCCFSTMPQLSRRHCHLD